VYITNATSTACTDSVCMYMCMEGGMYTRIHPYVCVYASTCVRHFSICVFTYTYLRVYIYVCVCRCVCAIAYISLRFCVNVCAYSHVYAAYRTAICLEMIDLARTMVVCVSAHVPVPVPVHVRVRVCLRACVYRCQSSQKIYARWAIWLVKKIRRTSSRCQLLLSISSNCRRRVSACSKN